MYLNPDATLPSRVSLGTSLNHVILTCSKRVTAASSLDTHKRQRGPADLPAPEGAAGTAQETWPISPPRPPSSRCAVLLPVIPEVGSLRSVSGSGAARVVVGRWVPWATCRGSAAAGEIGSPGGPEAALTRPDRTGSVRRGPLVPRPRASEERMNERASGMSLGAGLLPGDASAARSSEGKGPE